MRANDKTAALRERGSQYPHGVRARYSMGGCRCPECRRAQREAARKRYGREHHPTIYGPVEVRLVPAAPVADHVRRLMAQGIGLHSLAETAGVQRRKLRGLLGLGMPVRRRILAAHAEAILGVTVAAARRPAQVVDATETWRMIRWLLRSGMTRGQIAQELGADRPALQLGERRVLASTEVKVRTLYRSVRGPR